MPKLQKDKYTTYEQHYYKETKWSVSEVVGPRLQQEIAEHIRQQPNHLPPDGTACESGYSSIRLSRRVYRHLNINPSMVEKFEPVAESSALILRRLATAPKLPVSCLASAEHVVAMQNRVTDFVSESIPRSKKRVVYQILAKPMYYGMTKNEQKDRLRTVILESDDMLQEKDVSITYQNKCFMIELSTHL